MYAPLWCKSNFSFLEGASDPAELIEQAGHLGLRSIAVTDRDGLYGVVQAHTAAREMGLHVIVGAEMTVADPGVVLSGQIRAGSRPTAKPGAQFERPDVSTIVLLVEDRDGYRNLCRLITRGRRRSPKGASIVTWQEVAEHAGGLIALWGGDRSLLTRPDDLESGLSSGGTRASFRAGQQRLAGGPPLETVAPLLQDAFGERLFAVISRHRRADEVRKEWRLREHASEWNLPLVAATEVLYHSPSRRDVQDVLSCIRYGVKLSDAGRRIRANAEHSLLSPDAFARAYSDEAAAIARSCEIAERCTFSMGDLRYRYPSERLPDGTTTDEWLRYLTVEGAKRRYLQPRGDEGARGDGNARGHENDRGDESAPTVASSSAEIPPDFSQMTAGLGEAWRMTGIAFKPYACGTMCQPFIDAAIRLAEQGVRPADVAEVNCRVGEATVHRLWEPKAEKARPSTPYSAKFSVPYCVAVGLIDRAAGLEQFTQMRLADPEVLALAAKVGYRIDPANEYPRNYSGHVRLTTLDGQVHQAEQPHLRGGTRQPLSSEELAAKFRANTAHGGFPETLAADLAAWCATAFDAPNLSGLARFRV